MWAALGKRCCRLCGAEHLPEPCQRTPSAGALAIAALSQALQVGGGPVAIADLLAAAQASAGAAAVTTAAAAAAQVAGVAAMLWHLRSSNDGGYNMRVNVYGACMRASSVCTSALGSRWNVSSRSALLSAAAAACRPRRRDVRPLRPLGFLQGPCRPSSSRVVAQCALLVLW